MTPDWTATRLFPDARDASKDPTCYLDPYLILKLRRWVMTEEGWEELKKAREGYRPSGGRFAPEGALNNNGGN